MKKLGQLFGALVFVIMSRMPDSVEDGWAFRARFGVWPLPTWRNKSIVTGQLDEMGGCTGHEAYPDYPGIANLAKRCGFEN
jgi:hypothetical protein